MEEENVYDVICRGPLLSQMGTNPEDVIECLEFWNESGNLLKEFLGIKDGMLNDSQRIRIYHYYLPVYLWCHRQLLHHRSTLKDSLDIPPIVVGVSAPQGSGKSTLVSALEYLFCSSGRKAVSVSIDDFYLTAADQAKLASENEGNTLLELRGNAGTHDLELGANTLKALCELTQKGIKAKIPRYDKSAYEGKGDRADPLTWPEVEGPLEVVFLEGWMLGFQPSSAEKVKTVDPQLEIINKNLESYFELWERFIDSWIVIKIRNIEWIPKWRLQAETAMRKEGKSAMSDEQVFDFVSRYMPAYKAYLPHLYKDGPPGSKLEHTLMVELDENRNPVYPDRSCNYDDEENLKI